MVHEGEPYAVEVDGATVASFNAPCSRLVTVACMGDTFFALHLLGEELETVTLTGSEVFGVTVDEPPYDWRKIKWVKLLELPGGRYLLRHGRAQMQLTLGAIEE